MTLPLISVIIPLFNKGPWIQETLNSVFASEEVNLEVWVIDDGSTDQGPEIVKNYVNSNLTLISTTGRTGASAARNLGLQNSTGEFILFLDADDLIHPKKLKYQLNTLLTQPNLISFGYTWYFQNGDPLPNPTQALPDPFYHNSESPPEFLLALYGISGVGSMIPVHAWLTPKNLIDKAGPWDTRITVDDDGEFFCRVVLNASNIIYIPEAWGYYRKFPPGSHNLSGQNHYKGLQSHVLAIDQKLNAFSKHPNPPINYQKAFAKLYMDYGGLAWPQFPDISSYCFAQIKKIGGTTHLPFLGNPILEKLKPIVGWKFLKLLSYIWYHIPKRK
jgi:glycosyltransferase involved in cell wall biosynthesis